MSEKEDSGRVKAQGDNYQRSQTIPYSQSGIVIREPIIRLVSPPTEARCKVKGKAVATEGNICGRNVQFLLPRRQPTTVWVGEMGKVVERLGVVCLRTQWNPTTQR
ncbi:hypothetical protein Bca4012_048581 [Brassica carinata]